MYTKLVHCKINSLPFSKFSLYLNLLWRRKFSYLCFCWMLMSTLLGFPSFTFFFVLVCLDFKSMVLVQMQQLSIWRFDQFRTCSWWDLWFWSAGLVLCISIFFQGNNTSNIFPFLKGGGNGGVILVLVRFWAQVLRMVHLCHHSMSPNSFENFLIVDFVY